MKNNTFNLSRFALVVRKDLQENWKKNLMLALTLFGIMFIIYMSNSISDYSSWAWLGDDPHYDMQSFTEQINKEYTLYAFLLFVASFPIYISMMMEPMSSKRKRTQYLMIPASSLEKFLSRFLQFIVGFVIVFFASFYLVDFIRVAICTPLYPEIDVRSIDLSILFRGSSPVFDNFDNFLIFVFYFTLTLSLFVLGTTFWQKNVFVKNFVGYVLLVTVMILTMRGLMNILSDKPELYMNSFLNDKQLYYSGNMLLIVSVTMVLSIFNCVLAYFRFKESEFIQRW